MILALLLARLGVSTTLLEAREDFDRAFRGDTVHPSTLEMLHDLGLADSLLARDHGKLERMTLHSGKTAVAVLADFTRLRSRFPFVAMIPQVEFLNFIVGEAKKYDSFDLRMGARVNDLIIEDEVVCGVRYRDRDGERELRTSLTVAADGRASRVRKLAGFTPKKNAAAMDVMWLVLPRGDDERGIDMTGFRIGRGRLVVVLARADQWQLAYVILKGDSHSVREGGLDAFRSEVATLVPELADRVDTIRDWTDIHFLSVESSRIAATYAVLEQPVEAVDWLRRTADKGMPNYLLFDNDPLLDPMRDDAGFVAFMSELKPRWERLRREAEAPPGS